MACVDFFVVVYSKGRLAEALSQCSGVSNPAICSTQDSLLILSTKLGQNRGAGLQITRAELGFSL